MLYILCRLAMRRLWAVNPGPHGGGGVLMLPVAGLRYGAMPTVWGKSQLPVDTFLI